MAETEVLFYSPEGTLLDEFVLAPTFFPRFLQLANGYFISVRDFTLGQLVYTYDAAGALTGTDTMAIGDCHFSYSVNGAPRLVSQQNSYAQSAWTMKTMLYEFDTQGVFEDSLLLRQGILDTGESPSGNAYFYRDGMLTFLMGSVTPSSTIIDFRVWLSTYDGVTVTDTPPWDPGPLPLHAYVTSWGILRTADTRFVLSAFIRGDSNMQFWFLGLETDGTFNTNIHTQEVAANHLLNGLTMKEHDGSLLYAFTEVTTDGSYGGGAQVAAFPLNELMAADDTRPEMPDAMSLRAYPNPFNASSTIEYELAREGFVRLTIIDVLGREVGVLKTGPTAAGVHRLSWSANEIASGKYFVRLQADEQSRVIPLTLTK